MQIAVLVVPYDSGRRGWRMGAGPEHLLASGLAQSFERAGHSVRTAMLETSGDEVIAAFDLARQIMDHVREADKSGVFPLILAGNCIASLGGIAGLDSRPAILWLDAHADLNTPETSESGFLDGMALAVITGRCSTEHAKTINGFAPIPDSEVLMLGVRSVDRGEEAALQKVKRIRSSRELWSALAASTRRDLYLHIDLDALDPNVLVANSFASPRGLSLHTLHDAIDAVKANKRVAALAITAYDPSADRDNNGPELVEDIIRRVIST